MQNTRTGLSSVRRSRLHEDIKRTKFETCLYPRNPSSKAIGAEVTLSEEWSWGIVKLTKGGTYTKTIEIVLVLAFHLDRVTLEHRLIASETGWYNK